jgi:MoxR-like ATPase
MRWTDLGGSGRLAFVVRLRERERELAAIEVLLERRGGVLVFEGRAGIGKTSLVEVAYSRADELGTGLTSP